MKEYTELLNIKYNNKLFKVLSYKNHKKDFLEIKDNNYYYPELVDLVNLNLIFNIDSEVLYKIDKKDILKGTLAFIAVSNLTILGLTAFDKINYTLNKDKIIETKIEFYNTNGYADEVIYIDNNKDLEKYGLTQASFKDVRETLNNNETINEEYKQYILDFLASLEERLPKIDLSIFNHNLKTLTVTEIENDNWPNNTTGEYDNIRNTILMKTEYHSETEKKMVIYHELGHVLNNTIITLAEENNDYSKNIKVVRVIRSFANKNEKFGLFGVEGFNAVLTDYLISRDWEHFFEYENYKFDSYNEIAVNCFELMKLMDYSFYDYLDGNVNSFIKELSLYNLNNYDENKVVDILDTILAVYRDDNRRLKVENLATAYLLKEEIVKARLKKEFSMGTNEIDILNQTYKLFPYNPDKIYEEISAGYETNICYKRLTVKEKGNDTDGADLIVDSLTETGFGRITLYNDNNNHKEENINIRDVYIYEVGDSYKFCFYKYIDGIKHLYDFETNNEIEEDMFIYSIEAFLQINFDLPTYDENMNSHIIHDFSINTNLINNPYLYEDLEHSYKGKPKTR